VKPDLTYLQTCSSTLHGASGEEIIDGILEKFNATGLRLPSSQGTGLIPAEILMKFKCYFYELLILLPYNEGVNIKT